jgi:hypothetical protein
MTRFLLCLTSVLVAAFIAGCASDRLPALTLSPEVSESAGSSHSIAWGLISLRELWNIDSGYARVCAPGLLPMLGAPVANVSADMVFRDEGAGKEFRTRVVSVNQREQVFACALPEGKYRLTVNAAWPYGPKWTCGSERYVTCTGGGEAIYIGFLKFGITRDTPFMYDATSASPGEAPYSFEQVLTKFLADNPKYMGQVSRQKIVGEIR